MTAASRFEFSIRAGRGPGRRVSRRCEQGYEIDHGAPYLTVRDDRYKRFVDSWIRAGIAKVWVARIFAANKGELTPKHEALYRYVGVPGTAAVAHPLAAPIKLRKNVITEAENWHFWNTIVQYSDMITWSTC